MPQETVVGQSRSFLCICTRRYDKMMSRCAYISLFFTFVLASPTMRDLRVHEARQQLPRGFTLTGPAPEDATLHLRIALAQNDPDGLIKALMDVSTPSSALYGQHLSKTEVSPTEFCRKFVLECNLILNHAMFYRLNTSHHLQRRRTQPLPPGSLRTG